MEYQAPRDRYLWSAHLEDLIAACGGARAVCALLDVTPRTLRRWRQAARGIERGTRPVTAIPKMALRLLWFASWRGRAAAAADLTHELQYVYFQMDGMRRDAAAVAALQRGALELGSPHTPMVDVGQAANARTLDEPAAAPAPARAPIWKRQTA